MTFSFVWYNSPWISWHSLIIVHLLLCVQVMSHWTPFLQVTILLSSKLLMCIWLPFLFLFFRHFISSHHVTRCSTLCCCGDICSFIWDVLFTWNVSPHNNSSIRDGSTSLRHMAFKMLCEKNNCWSHENYYFSLINTDYSDRIFFFFLCFSACYIENTVF